MLWRGADAFRVRRECDDKFGPRPDLTERAQIKGLQGNIGLHDSGGQFAAEPSEQTIPIAADSEGLHDRLSTDVRVTVPQPPKERERGSEVTSLGELERSE